MTHPDQPVTSATIARLTSAEQDALGLIAINQDGSAKKKAIRSLLSMGLIEAYPVLIHGSGSAPINRIPIKVTRYALPPHVMYAWCQWCDDTMTPEKKAAL